MNEILRLLQIADSSFPIGGYAYSHGLESLRHAGRLRTENDLCLFLRAHVSGTLRGQTLPAARQAYTAPSLQPVLRVDEALDASIVAACEREAGRAMGERLLAESVNAFAVEEGARLLECVRRGETPGQHPVAWAIVCRGLGIPREMALAGIAQASLTSLAAAAVRLGVVGQGAAARLIASLAGDLADAVEAAPHVRQLRFGAFAPRLEVALLAHPNLPFRVFAS